MSRPLRAFVDASALAHNLRRVREAAPGRRVIAIVKADAYGHGLLAAADALAGADAFGVAALEEALRLRAHGVRVPVLLLATVLLGAFSKDDLRLLLRRRRTT